MTIATRIGVLVQILGAITLVGCAASRPAPVENRAVKEPAYSQGQQVAGSGGRTVAAPLGARGDTAALAQPAAPGRGADITFTPVEVSPPSASESVGVASQNRIQVSTPDAPQVVAEAAAPVELPRRDSRQIGDDSPDAVLSLLNQANAHEGRGEYSRASATIERAISIDRRNPWLWHRLASLKFSEGDYGQAAQLAGRSNSLAQEDLVLQGDNWRLMSAAYHQLGDQQASRDALSKAEELARLN